MRTHTLAEIRALGHSMASIYAVLGSQNMLIKCRSDGSEIDDVHARVRRDEKHVSIALAADCDLHFRPAPARFSAWPRLRRVCLLIVPCSENFELFSTNRHERHAAIDGVLTYYRTIIRMRQRLATSGETQRWCFIHQQPRTQYIYLAVITGYGLAVVSLVVCCCYCQ